METNVVTAMRKNHSLPQRCESCQTDENGPCIKHCSTFISDQNPLPRAYATLPWQLLIRGLEGEHSESKNVEGVFARMTIPTGTVFGPVVGPLVDAELYQRTYQFGLIQDNKLYVYNLTGDNRSNWMKFVRLSDNPNKVNLMAYQHGLQVYFITLRTILADEELCVGYSYHYAKSIGKIHPDSEVSNDLADNLEGIVLSLPVENEPSVDTNSFNSFLPVGENIELKANEIIENEMGLFQPDMFNEGPPPKKRKARAHTDKKKRDKRSKYEALTKELLSRPAEGVAENDDDVDYEEEVDEPDSPQPKISRRRKKIEIDGAIIELPEKEKKIRKDRPLSEVEQLMITEKKLTSASISLAKHRLYEHVCKDKVCTAEYKIPSLLAIHETKHGADIPEGFTTPGPRKCPACETEVPSFGHLVNHIVEHQRYYRNRRKGLLCDNCGKMLASEKMLARHKARLHTGEVVKPFECDKCDGKFVTLAALKSHINFHHGSRKGFECPVCLESFSGSAALNLHSETHRVNGKFPCRICLNVYDSWLTVRRHMKVQHKSKDIICNICQKAFRRTEQLTRHQVVHFDVFNFACDVCGRKFKREAKLVEHQKRLHNPARQYKLKNRSEKVAQSFAHAQVCSFCHKQYSSVERLLEHQRIKHGQNLLLL